MKRIVVCSLIAVACACGDNIQTVPADSPNVQPADAGIETWRDAERVWAIAWCSYAERCFPDQFAEVFGDQGACRASVLQNNCDNPYRADPCDSPYPVDRLSVLAECRYDMETLPCAATQAPESCWRAFE